MASGYPHTHHRERRFITYIVLVKYVHAQRGLPAESHANRELNLCSASLEEQKNG